MAPLTLTSLDHRVSDLERGAIVLRETDSRTATSVDKLTSAINDPKQGLIVELDRFRQEVQHDRDTFRAWIRGATVVLSLVFTTVTILAPLIRTVLESVLKVSLTP